MRLVLLPLALSLAIASPVRAQDAHEHHAPPAAADAAPSTEQRWATDAPLREGMRAIRDAVVALGHYEQGHLAPEQAVEHARQVEAAVRDIIANCKLPPDADAALHSIIAPLMTNAGALRADPKKLEAIAAMREALAAYALRFDDPDFAAADR